MSINFLQRHKILIVEMNNEELSQFKNQTT